MDVPTPGPAQDQTFRLIYRSRDRIPEPARRAALGALFSEARANNKKSDLTGALLVRDDWFVQTLEGSEAVVRGLFARIEADPRHDSVEVVHATTVPTRVFARWSMARIASDEHDIPLIAHVNGIADAAPRGDGTAEQELVLELMRDATRR